MQLVWSPMQLCAIIMQLLGWNELQWYSKFQLIICPKHNTALWTCTTTPSSLCARWGSSCGNIFTLNRKTLCPLIQHWTIAYCRENPAAPGSDYVHPGYPPNYLCAGGVSRNIMVLKAWVHLINPNCIDHKPFFFNKKVHNPWHSSYII